jgi:hypothetical protein
VIEQIKPIAIPLMQAHQLVGCSRTQFKKIFVDGDLIVPIDLGGRGLSIIVAEVEDAVLKRAAMIRSGELVPPIRSSRGKRRQTTSA